jgi:hypothetical protein
MIWTVCIVIIVVVSPIVFVRTYKMPVPTALLWTLPGVACLAVHLFNEFGPVSGLSVAIYFGLLLVWVRSLSLAKNWAAPKTSKSAGDPPSAPASGYGFSAVRTVPPDEPTNDVKQFQSRVVAEDINLFNQL